MEETPTSDLARWSEKDIRNEIEEMKAELLQIDHPGPLSADLLCTDEEGNRVEVEVLYTPESGFEITRTITSFEEVNNQ